ncbi:MAG: hypothetical protein AAB074_01600 [Planctomycetota bacterium]
MKRIEDTYEGRFVHGRVEWKGGKPPPEGARVEALGKTRGGKSRKRSVGGRVSAGRDIWQVLRKFEGKAASLPADLGPNLDHYLYGVPRK